MGKKRASKSTPNATPRPPQMSVTIREASTGKKQTNVNSKSLLKLEHIKNLATWTSGEASIPSLGAFFGHHFAATSEVLATPPDPSMFTCQRCESILQPGYNCTVRIEKNTRKAWRRRKKSTIYPQNNVVYKCNFCSHRNLKRGTPKGHMKEICPPKVKTPRKLETMIHTVGKCTTSTRANMGISQVNEIGEVTSSAMSKDDTVTEGPATPVEKTGLTFLDAKKKKRTRSGANKTAAPENASSTIEEKSLNTSTKRRRKSWTCLKEIAEISENDNKKRFMNLAVPFSI